MNLGRIGLATAFVAFGLVPQALFAAPASPFNWSGAYVGANLGAGIVNSDVGSVTFFSDVGGTTPVGSLPGYSYSGTGIIGGAEVGYNWQTSSAVVGIEADVSASGAIASYSDPVADYSLNTKLNWLSTARLKFGLPSGNLLVYGTGGIAFGQIQTDLQDNYPDDSTVYNLSNSQTVVGWTAGAGVAAAVNEHWVVKAEYLYTDLGTHTFSYSEDPTSAIGWPLVSAQARLTTSIVRVGVDYKF